MGSIRPVTPVPTAQIPALLLCPHCNLEMALFGIETETVTRDLYTFECSACGTIEVRGVGVPCGPAYAKDRSAML
jgi:hypothetical protein